MKLIRLYIENFGGLSGYSLDFQEGVTVIQEPNGFGKTTLAEFIRAMFYGFPRKAKTLDKSRRQKYMPWNGGKCGGNLVFEVDGAAYRVERTFGATPRSDTFTLIDLSTNQKSDRFSEELGLELFRLDADSFERSTYMPQTAERLDLTTDTIQAKLGNLVEDTGDINRFEKAMAALKNKRISYALYRGNGGSVWEAQNQITALQRKLDDAGGKVHALEENDRRMEQLETEVKDAENALSQTREKLTIAAESSAVVSAKKQEQELSQQHRQWIQKSEQFREKYPSGLPDGARIDEALQAAERYALLAEQEVTAPADLEAEALVNRLAPKYVERIPSGEELTQHRQGWERLKELQLQLAHLGLTEAEQTRLNELATVSGLSDERLDELEARNGRLRILRERMTRQVMTEEEREALSALEQYFAAGIPELQTLDQYRRTLTRIEELRQENARLMTPLTEEKPRKKNGWLTALLLVLALAALAGGIALLVGKMYIPGGIGIGIGVLALIGSAFLGIRQMVARELSGVSGMDRVTQLHMEENNREAALLEENVRQFVHGYTGSPVMEGLHEIRTQRERILALREKQRAGEEERRRLETEAASLEEELKRTLPGEPYDRSILALRMARKEYLTLSEKQSAADTRRKAVEAECDTLRQSLTAYLQNWFDEIQSHRIGVLLEEIQRESDAYRRAAVRKEEWNRRKEAHEAALTQCKTRVDEFFQTHNLAAEEDVPAQLRRLRAEEKEYRDAEHWAAQWEEKLRLFRDSNAQLLSRPLPERTDDPEVLKAEERKWSDRVSELTRQLLEHRQTHWNLRAETDKIPALRDELEQWQQKKTEDQKKAQLLDETMEYLQKAKDSLSTRYLTPLRTGFAGYLSRLAGEEPGGVLVTPELQVQLERMGQCRELAYFSTGQADLVMLCMRFALVDALFADTKPFVILDDPFVNLDDERTKKALQLLRELSRDRQIIYLVCNSSRRLEG